MTSIADSLGATNGKVPGSHLTPLHRAGGPVPHLGLTFPSIPSRKRLGQWPLWGRGLHWFALARWAGGLAKREVTQDTGG